MRRIYFYLFATALAVAGHAQAFGTEREAIATPAQARPMKIHLTVNGQSMAATLIDSPTTREFLALLPLTLTLEDYASTEKIAYLPRKLSTDGAPAGITPAVGDITYYAPWGNLAIFYRDFAYSPGLVRLGRLDAGIQALAGRGAQKVAIRAGVPPPK